MSSTVIIPARFNSTRLPGKVLLQLGDIPVIQHVYNRAIEADVGRVYIATEDKEVADACASFASIIMTKKHDSGTSRIAEASRQVGADYLINIQGDEPFIDPLLIRQLSLALQSGCSWVSAYQKIPSKSESINPNVVKVVLDSSSHGLYFSRSPIPFFKNEENHFGFKHIGVYAYEKKFLESWSAMPSCALENYENLEQLRGLYFGHKIKLLEANKPSIGIDTMEDFQQAQQLLKGASL